MSLSDWLHDPGIQGAFARFIHSRWLTRAIAGGKPYPRIPVRRVDAGGWDELMRTPEGRQSAERWWSSALASVDEA